MDLEIADTGAHDGWAVAKVSGELDVATAPKLRERLTEAIDAGSTRLVVDLADVDFVDSTGLGVLVGALRRAREGGGEVRLVCTNHRILKVFQATGLHEVFRIGATVDDVVALEG